MNQLIRIEYAALASLAVVTYFMLGGGWQMLIILILVPDIAMLGYLAGSRIGAIAYNLTHNWIAPCVVMAIGVFEANLTMIHVGLIWAVHIAGDRALGFGLKFTSGFKHTHMGDLGKD